MKQIILCLILICSSFALDAQWKRLLWKRSKVTAKNDDKDQPLNVDITQIGDRFVIFNITGSDTVGGLPVQQLVVNYTIGETATEIKTKTLLAESANGRLEQIIKLEDLLPGLRYRLQFSAENSKKQSGPPSQWIPVLLLPPTPDITVDHISLHQLKVKWGETKSQSEDYYLLTVEKKSALGCGLTINLTSCFGNKYTLDDLEVGQVYKLTMRAHNPTGFSEPVVVSYPID